MEYMDSSRALGLLISTLIVMIFLLLILREILRWYWKINERIKLQKENNDLLRDLISKIDKTN
jgi:uncharacterized membrane protein YcjF (UPF0283 family)